MSNKNESQFDRLYDLLDRIAEHAITMRLDQDSDRFLELSELYSKVNERLQNIKISYDHEDELKYEIQDDCTHYEDEWDRDESEIYPIDSYDDIYA